MPDVIKKLNWKIFGLMMAWSILPNLAPIGLLLWDWIRNYDDPVNWTFVWHQAVILTGTGVIMFWRKNRALLELPPGIEELIRLHNELGIKCPTPPQELKP